MALLDFLRNFEERTGRRIEENIGGLLGEDLSKLPEAERKAIRRQMRMRAIESLGSLGSQSQAMADVAEGVGKRLETRRAKERQAAAEALIPQITGRLFGGAPAATMPEQAEDGLTGVNVQSRYRQDPADAMRMMMGSQAGRDLATLQPDLAKLAQEGVTGRTVGGAVYNPLTGQFMRPPEEKKPVREVDLGNRVRVMYSDGTFEDLKKGVAPGAGGAGGAAKDPQDLRKEVNAQLKPYAEIGDMWAKVRQAGTNPTAANDLALIFGYMKILDPGSVVREGEFANAQNSAGVPDRVRAMYNSVLRGERLSEVQRQDFLKSAYGAVQSQAPRVQAVVDYYTEVANAIGVKPSAVIRNPLQDAMIPKVRSDADYEKLAPGTLFEDPNGNLRTKPRAK